VPTDRGRNPRDGPVAIVRDRRGVGPEQLGDRVVVHAAAQGEVEQCARRRVETT